MRILLPLALVFAACAAPDDAPALPREDQLAAFKAAPAAEKVAMYRAHMLRVAARPGLTKAQRAAVMRAADEVEPADYGPHTPEDWEARTGPASYVGAIRDAFGDNAKDVLYNLD
jgi:hypothetical protein